MYVELTPFPPDKRMKICQLQKHVRFSFYLVLFLLFCHLFMAYDLYCTMPTGTPAHFISHQMNNSVLPGPFVWGEKQTRSTVRRKLSRGLGAGEAFWGRTWLLLICQSTFKSRVRPLVVVSCKAMTLLITCLEFYPERRGVRTRSTHEFSGGSWSPGRNYITNHNTLDYQIYYCRKNKMDDSKNTRQHIFY